MIKEATKMVTLLFTSRTVSRQDEIVRQSLNLLQSNGDQCSMQQDESRCKRGLELR